MAVVDALKENDIENRIQGEVYVKTENEETIGAYNFDSGEYLTKEEMDVRYYMDRIQAYTGKEPEFVYHEKVAFDEVEGIHDVEQMHIYMESRIIRRRELICITSKWTAVNILSPIITYMRRMKIIIQPDYFIIPIRIHPYQNKKAPSQTEGNPCRRCRLPCRLNDPSKMVYCSTQINRACEGVSRG